MTSLVLKMNQCQKFKFYSYF